MRDSAQIEDVVTAVAEQLGPVDILVNAAGVAAGGAAHTMAEPKWDHTVDINLKGSSLMTKHVIPAMIARGAGSIIHIGSTMALEGGPGTFAYSASKGDLEAMDSRWRSPTQCCCWPRTKRRS